MDLADDTVARLTELAELSGADLVLLFRDLVRSAVATSSSCVAVIISLGQEAPFYALDDRLRSRSAVVRSSLRAQIATTGPGRHVHQVIFLAEVPSEYSHLTALPLASFASSTGKLDRLIIDGDLDAAKLLLTDDPSITGPRKTPTERLRTIDQAIGFLLDRGLTPDEGHQKLAEQALADGNDIYDQALAVLGQAGNDP
ncbi:hypothetical protein [Kineosporia sp. NBRC 101731]|uniref:hypothetical protein n=1 Tax=Kineosporia sp. NBRC 101731 TaxID=3032199 RepID=UPI0024A19FD3|nr:hypothetical protein [Kineosporia sp. NBRC 101731]GLY33231.1 hypothetical protein Kisp02_65960 [Kineosporia sp. NBRC 101731]